MTSESMWAILTALDAVASGNLRTKVALAEDSSEEMQRLADGVNRLIEAWRASELRGRKAKRALEEKIALVEAQAVTIRELSTPVMQIWEETLLVPLVGTLSGRRSVELTSELLDQVQHTGASQVIVDVTGVEAIDQEVAASLLQVARSVRLLGAECLLTGISPKVARTLAELGVDLGELRTLRTLEAGLVACIENVGSG